MVDSTLRYTVLISSFVAEILHETSGIYPLSDENHILYCLSLLTKLLADSAAFQDAMPHPLCDVAKGRMVYSIPLIIFEDDVSGNRSKQWNKHYSCYMSNGALPRTKLDNEFHVRFVATSPHATPLEIM